MHYAIAADTCIIGCSTGDLECTAAHARRRQAGFHGIAPCLGRYARHVPDINGRCRFTCRPLRCIRSVNGNQKPKSNLFRPRPLKPSGLFACQPACSQLANSLSNVCGICEGFARLPCRIAPRCAHRVASVGKCCATCSAPRQPEESPQESVGAPQDRTIMLFLP